MKNTISELKNKAEGIKSRLDEAEYQISELEDKVERNTQKSKTKRKNNQKYQRGIKGTAGQYEKE